MESLTSINHKKHSLLSIFTDCAFITSFKTISSFTYWPIFQSHFLEPTFYITMSPRSDGGLGRGINSILNRGCNWTRITSGLVPTYLDLFSLGPEGGEILWNEQHARVKKRVATQTLPWPRENMLFSVRGKYWKGKPYITMSAGLGTSWRFIPMTGTRLGHYIWITRLQFTFG